MQPWDRLVDEDQDSWTLTEVVTSLDDVLGSPEGQQEVSGVPLSVHRLDEAEHKICTQTLQFFSQTESYRHSQVNSRVRCSENVPPYSADRFFNALSN